jgi:hypothetical protein
VLSRPEKITRSYGVTVTTLSRRGVVTNGTGFGMIAALGVFAVLVGIGVLTGVPGRRWSPCWMPRRPEPAAPPPDIPRQAGSG